MSIKSGTSVKIFLPCSINRRNSNFRRISSGRLRTEIIANASYYSIERIFAYILRNDPLQFAQKFIFATIPIVRLYATEISFTQFLSGRFYGRKRAPNLAQFRSTYATVHVVSRAKRQDFLYLAETARKIEYLLTKFSDRKISIWRLLNILRTCVCASTTFTRNKKLFALLSRQWRTLRISNRHIASPFNVLFILLDVFLQIKIFIVQTVYSD